MKEVVFSDPSKGYEIEVSYKDGSKSSKFFTAHQFAKANNYFNKMNKSMDKNVHTVKTKRFHKLFTRSLSWVVCIYYQRIGLQIITSVERRRKYLQRCKRLLMHTISI